MKKLSSFLVVMGLSLAAATSFASVKTAGDWPSDEKRVSVKIEAQRAEAVKQLAEAAGWNIVVPDKLGGGTESLHVAVKDESPLAVLEALLASGDFTATRHGKLVVVSETKDVAAAPRTTADAAATTPEPPAKPAEPEPASHDREGGEDRSVMGGNAVIAKDERVHDVSVMGGNLDIFGTVTGDVSVVGGNARIKDGARVMGDAVAVGGALDVDNGARVDGDVGVVGGVLHRHDGAVIRGKTVSSGGNVTSDDDGGSTRSAPGGKAKILHQMSGAGSAVTRAAMLFVFGVVLLSFFKKRHDAMKLDIVHNPVKGFGIGIIALFLSLVASVVLCITVIGIPLVVIGWLFAALCIYGGVVSVLTLVGELVLRHKTQNAYAHLVVGCLIYLVVGAIPVAGGVVTAILFFVAIGAVWRTRAGGLFAKEPKSASVSAAA